ncbi:MAG: hypothetical protein EZS28_002124 [Streblomastix strix]|uniref:TmcB/TmcC TPR repeats domain-containing protein n=1 Tax=Streblomastix strix TaxID=222440 RepID=A0A5J4X5R1_9EUKA|nr:MAG: hypothetical protein EZS28_002124 [Streblomastix strix]
MNFVDSRRWLLIDDGQPLIDVQGLKPKTENNNDTQQQQQNDNNQQQQSNQNTTSKDIQTKQTATIQFPKIKDPDSVEPWVRFLQHKELRDKRYLDYADYVCTRGLKRQKRNAQLQFKYGNFIIQYTKNRINVQSIHKFKRQQYPNFSFRFVLNDITKDSNSKLCGSVKRNMNEMNTSMLNRKMAQAEKYHESAKQEMKDFFENMTSSHTNFDIRYRYLMQIVEFEQKSRFYYEELMVLQPMNATVLPNYAHFLKYISR